MCRGSKALKRNFVIGGDASSEEKKESDGHPYDGFLTIWPTASSYPVLDEKYLSTVMTNTIESKYNENWSLHRMLQTVQEEIRKKKDGQLYCIEEQNTARYRIVFRRNTREKRRR